MIVTQEKRIPWAWAVMMAMPYLGVQLVEAISHGALTFSMKKFISDPALLTFIASINIAFNFLVAPFVAWKSDRIWTRFGRRKPFILVGWAGLVVSLICVPLAPNIWTLVLAIIAYQFFQDFSFTGPYEPLVWEVVPRSQRGRTAAFTAFFRHCGTLYYNFFLIGQFYEVYQGDLTLGSWGSTSFHLTGEMLIYGGAAALLLVMMVQLGMNVKETQVNSSLIGERFSLRTYLGGVFGERQWLLIYMLIFTQIAMNSGLANLGPLLIKEQFGYDMAMLGKIGGINTLLQILIIIPLAGLVADRFDRLRLYQVGLFISMLQPISYFFFVKFVAPNQVPNVPSIIIFEMFGTFVHLMGNIALMPLLFDYVPRNKMGTAYAGMTFVRGIVKMVIVNGVGIWVSVLSRLTLPEGQYDYMLGYLYVFAIGVMGFLCSIYFASERKKGHLIEYGRLESQAEQKTEEEELTTHA